MDIITYPCWALTHRGRVTHIRVSKVTRSVPSHYLNQCWNIVNWTLRNKLQWNLNRNSYISIQENAFKIVWKMAIILSRPQCVMLIHACKTGNIRKKITSTRKEKRQPLHNRLKKLYITIKYIKMALIWPVSLGWMRSECMPFGQSSMGPNNVHSYWDVFEQICSQENCVLA